MFLFTHYNYGGSEMRETIYGLIDQGLESRATNTFDTLSHQINVQF